MALAPEKLRPVSQCVTSTVWCLIGPTAWRVRKPLANGTRRYKAVTRWGWWLMHRNSALHSLLAPGSPLSSAWWPLTTFLQARGWTLHWSTLSLTEPFKLFTGLKEKVENSEKGCCIHSSLSHIASIQHTTTFTAFWSLIIYITWTESVEFDDLFNQDKNWCIINFYKFMGNKLDCNNTCLLDWIILIVKLANGFKLS